MNQKSNSVCGSLIIIKSLAEFRHNRLLIVRSAKHQPVDIPAYEERNLQAIFKGDVFQESIFVDFPEGFQDSARCASVREALAKGGGVLAFKFTLGAGSFPAPAFYEK